MSAAPSLEALPAFRPADAKALRASLAALPRKGEYVRLSFASLNLTIDDDGLFYLRATLTDGSALDLPLSKSDLSRLQRQMSVMSRIRKKLGSLTLAAADTNHRLSKRIVE